MKAMKKYTLTVFCILAGCIFFLSGIWIYFQKSLDRVELGEGEHAASYQRHYLMISNDKIINRIVTNITLNIVFS